MDIAKFYAGEKLYRAVKPMQPFIEDGEISSAAFTQKKNIKSGLSVDKQAHRSNEEAVSFIASSKLGYIVSITTNDCDFKNVGYEYCKTEDNLYHSEIYGNKEEGKFSLTKGQAKHMARVCKIELVRDDLGNDD